MLVRPQRRHAGHPPGARPAAARRRQRREVLEFFCRASGVPVTFLTGNHDPDLSRHHAAGVRGRAGSSSPTATSFSTPSCPGPRTRPMIRTRIIAALAALPGDGSSRLDGRLAAFRDGGRHRCPSSTRSETEPLRYTMRLVGRHGLAAPPGVCRSSGPGARRPGARPRSPGGTGPKAALHRSSATPTSPASGRRRPASSSSTRAPSARPFGAMVAEISPGRLEGPPRRTRKGGEFHPRPARSPQFATLMSMEFGWWVRDPEEGKYQVKAIVHGGNLKWLRKQGHFTLVGGASARARRTGTGSSPRPSAAFPGASSRPSSSPKSRTFRERR